MANDREFSNLAVRLPIEMRRQLEREAAAAERSVGYIVRAKLAAAKPVEQSADA